MTKYKYLKLNKYKKIRYLSINNRANLCVVFLHGFMSDLEGNKPKSLLKFCKKILNLRKITKKPENVLVDNM